MVLDSAAPEKWSVFVYNDDEMGGSSCSQSARSYLNELNLGTSVRQPTVSGARGRAFTDSGGDSPAPQQVIKLHAADLLFVDLERQSGSGYRVRTDRSTTIRANVGVPANGEWSDWHKIPPNRDMLFQISVAPDVDLEVRGTAIDGGETTAGRVLTTGAHKVAALFPSGCRDEYTRNRAPWTSTSPSNNKHRSCPPIYRQGNCSWTDDNFVEIRARASRESMEESCRTTDWSTMGSDGQRRCYELCRASDDCGPGVKKFCSNPENAFSRECNELHRGNYRLAVEEGYDSIVEKWMSEEGGRRSASRSPNRDESTAPLAGMTPVGGTSGSGRDTYRETSDGSPFDEHGWHGGPDYGVRSDNMLSFCKSLSLDDPYRRTCDRWYGAICGDSPEQTIGGGPGSKPEDFPYCACMYPMSYYDPENAIHQAGTAASPVCYISDCYDGRGSASRAYVPPQDVDCPDCINIINAEGMNLLRSSIRQTCRDEDGQDNVLEDDTPKEDKARKEPGGPNVLMWVAIVIGLLAVGFGAFFMYQRASQP